MVVGWPEGGRRKDRITGQIGEEKKSLRETFSPLKNLKTAKSGIFRVKGYQALSKTHDFAGETISFRFRFTWACFSPLAILGQERRADRRCSKIWKPPIVVNAFFAP
jgi:hypothetical protein